jgi:hypothetical protein
MKRSPGAYPAIFVLLILSSAPVASGTFQRQAEMERDLSATTPGWRMNIEGGENADIVLFNTHSRKPRFLIGDPLISGNFANPGSNPARDGFANNPARGLFMRSVPIRR